jgi:hypothetical protein
LYLLEKRGGDTMVTKKDIAVAILATFCLTSTLFMVIPIRSQVSTNSANEYDPWIDTNDDGIIDIFDIAALALAFGAEGTPINKTALLLELQNRLDELEERVLFLERIHNLPINWSDGLVGYWKFDEGEGTIALGSSGYGNNGTLLNGPTWVDGRYGKALSFDGVNDYVEVTQSSSLDIANSVSVTAWVYPKAFPASGIILSRWYDGTNPDRGIVLHLMPGSYHFGVIDDNNHLYVPFSFEINKWYYLAATWDGSVSKAYVNGVEIGSRSTSGSFTNQNLNLGIGSDINPINEHFNGTIDEVMIYNRALSEEEVFAHYIYPPP